ncbi:hypothetical protein [Amycolatopsis sp. NPDC049159]|uniref:hypothetical protein n=1 Tax=Amycolatopsis sp. NPDC049159 TaxID=3157210 RepID=UPI0033DD0672
MASEPAPRQDELIEKAARAMRDRWSTQTPPTEENYADARRLARRGLLADPEQTTELEEIQEALDEFQVRDADGPVPNVPLAEQVRVLFSEWTDAVAERDQLRERKQADLDELKRTLGLTRKPLKQNVEWRDRFRAERDEDRAELGETRRERDLALWLHAERDALLPRLAELAEASGKLRSAEWLRTCATLPVEEWPPAPAYKGPVVHLDDPRPDFAAMTKPQLRDLRLQIVNELRQRRGLPELEPSEPDLAAERDGLQAAVDRVRAWADSLETDFEGNPSLTGRAIAAAARGALQGDQPAEPRHELILKSGLSGVTGACSCGDWTGGGRHELPSRVAHQWDAEHLTSLAPEPGDQPTTKQRTLWPTGTPTVGERVTGIETQNVGQPVVTGYFHSSGVDGLSWLKVHADDPETAQRFLVATSTLKPAPRDVGVRDDTSEETP